MKPVIHVLIVGSITELYWALRCYSCSFSFNEQYDSEHMDSWCANESLVLFQGNQTTMVCAAWEAFCVVSL